MISGQGQTEGDGHGEQGSGSASGSRESQDQEAAAGMDDDDDLLERLVAMDPEEWAAPEMDDSIEGDEWIAQELASAEMQQGDTEEAPKRPNLRCPIAPSQEEFDDHCRRGHVQYRSWCPVCIRSRGREDPHRRGEVMKTRDGAPTICMDYKTLKKGEVPWIIVRDQRSRAIAAHKALCKGPRDKWLVERVNRDIENMGYTTVTLKGDNEPAMQQFMTAIKERRSHDTLIEGPPAVDPQANGVAEKAVQDLVGQARSLKVGLEYRTRSNLDSASAIVDWIPSHAAWLITHERVGPDGFTAIQRLTGRPCKQQLAEFGEQVWAKPLRRTSDKERPQATLDGRWLEGTWVGVHDRTGEHIVVLKTGQAIKVRTIKLKPESERWKADAISCIRATPRQPDPDGHRGQHSREGEGPGEDAGAAAAVPAQGGADIPEARVMPDMKIRRDFKVTRGLLDDLGPTPGCIGCEAAMTAGSTSRPHTRECRDRLEELMTNDPRYASRIQNRDRRHGLAPPEEAPATPRFGDDVEAQETGNVDGYAPTSAAGSRASDEDHGRDDMRPRGVGRPRESEEPNDEHARPRTNGESGEDANWVEGEREREVRLVVVELGCWKGA